MAALALVPRAPCEHDVLVWLTPELNRCQRCGELVTIGELHHQTMHALKHALYGPRPAAHAG